MRGGDGEYWRAVVAAQRFTPTGGTALCHVTGELSLTHKLRLLPPAQNDLELLAIQALCCIYVSRTVGQKQNLVFAKFLLPNWTMGEECGASSLHVLVR